MGQLSRVKFSLSTQRSQGLLDYVHSDMWGPAKQESNGGSIYFMTIIDDYSRRVWIYFLKSKDMAFEAFKGWKRVVENQVNRKVKTLRTDDGLEYCSSHFESFCKAEGIQRHYTVPS